MLMTSFLSAGAAESKDLTITPRVSISEEYNDNILLTSNKIDEYITRALPGIEILYDAPRLKVNFDGAVDYRYYANHSYYDKAPSSPGADETSYFVDALANAEVMKNIFNVEVRDLYERVSLDITRDYTQESLFVNQSDRNTFTVNPYFTLNITSATKFIAGYKFVDVWYKEDIGVDKQDHIGYGELRYEASSKILLNAGYEYTNEDSDDRDFDKHAAYAGGSYEYAENSLIDLRVGYMRVDYKNGPTRSRLFWNAGISQSFTYFTAALRTAQEYYENPSGNPQEVRSISLSVVGVLDRVRPKLTLYAAENHDSLTDDLDSRTLRGAASLGYDLTQKTAVLADYTIERIDDEQLDTYTTAYFTGIRLDYKPSDDLTFTLAYRHQNSHSPDIESDNYHSNRAIVEIAKRF